MPDQPFNIVRPSNEQIWACLQRCLSFEDPFARWERLLSLVTKQLHDDSLKVKDIPDWPHQYQDYLFTLLYGFNGKRPDIEPQMVAACGMLNIVLGLADIERFTEIAFESWLVSLKRGTNKELARLFRDQEDDEDVTDLGMRMNLSEAKVMWLQHMGRAVPDWTVLLQPGPWQGDPRVVFLCDMLERFVDLPADIAGILEGREIFNEALKRSRAALPGSFLPDLVLLVEGETETTLLPHFANLLGSNFSELGVMLSSAGGSKQVARKYFELRDVVTLPIVLFVDADAGEDIEVASEALRDNDRLHIWNAGEFEDTLDVGVLVNQLNIFLHSSGVAGTVSPADFPAEHRRTSILNRLWRARGLGNFDKIGFAEVVASNLRNAAEVPPDVKKAIRTVDELLQAERKKAQKKGA